MPSQHTRRPNDKAGNPITEAIIIHHSKAPRTQSIEAIRDFHTRPESEGGRGWQDVGYNFLIRQGVVHVGRPVWAIGAHAPGWNSRSVGICILGDYREMFPFPEDVNAAVALILGLLAAYPEAKILGHGEAMEAAGTGSRSCPGPFLTQAIKQALTGPVELYL